MAPRDPTYQFLAELEKNARAMDALKPDSDEWKKLHDRNRYLRSQINRIEKLVRRGVKF